MQINDIKKLESDLRELIQKHLPSELANYAVNFFKENFKRQGWAGKTFERWQATKTKRNIFGKSEGILIQSGNLKKSIRIQRIMPTGFIIAAGNQKIPYAQIHNEGGYIFPKVTPLSRKFF